jgi:alpha-L-arabinofuranosidase
MGGGGKTEIDALARASGHRPPHGGVYFGLGNERAKPLAFLPNWSSAGQALTEPHQRITNNGTLARRDVDG